MFYLSQMLPQKVVQKYGFISYHQSLLMKFLDHFIIFKVINKCIALPLQNGLTDNLPKFADSGHESNAENHL